MKNFFVIITAIIILYGCATVTPTGGTYESALIEDSKSRIVIFRTGGSLLAKEIPAVNIFGSEPSTYNLPSNSFIQEDVVPGMYEIVVSKDKSNSGLVWRFRNIGIKINTVKDETTYLELKAETNLITYSADILQVDKTEALESLKSLNRVLYTDSVE
mgnify:FL=1